MSELLEPAELRIRLKSTDLCGNFFCECGYFSHIDGEFIYYIECPDCSSVYRLHPVILLKKTTNIPEDERHFVRNASVKSG